MVYRGPTGIIQAYQKSLLNPMCSGCKAKYFKDDKEFNADDTRECAY